MISKLKWDLQTEVESVCERNNCGAPFHLCVMTHSEILPTIGFQNGEKMKNTFLKVLRGPKCM